VAWDYFKPGTHLGGVRVIDGETYASTQLDTTYRVVCRTCHAESVLTHAYLLQRELSGRVGCKECRGTARIERTVHEITPGGGVLLGRGDYWPKLGELGPRFGKQGAGGWVGSGASEKPI